MAWRKRLRLRRCELASFTERMIGAAKLDVHVYEEVEADTYATNQATGVVLLASLAGGIGSVGAWELEVLPRSLSAASRR